MAPKKTQTGASATTRRSTASSGARASSSSRTRATSKKPAAPKRAASRRAPAGKKAKRNAPASPGMWWLVPLAVVAALLAFSWLYYPVVRVQYRETRERARLQSELTSLQARNERLRDQVDRLKTPEGVEDYARSQLGLVKAGENAVVVVDGTRTNEDTGSPKIDSDRSLAQPVGPWTAFLDLVFGVR